ncbi:uncharacterized protein LOC142312197 [Anomaloglossus baeobatrachus]|uniref:uncharacterized protein LOC142312197 n=1 Tax=Anomaloglossus baeobatrachus TaxID=238106 RepID=UPI003F505B49
MDKDKMVERILHLTLEILFRLTGEDYTVVKKTSSERCQDPVSEGWERPLSPITGPPPHPLIHEDINDQKILELAYKMIELLTGEVPIRCQDITVYFSMEEWEYLEEHKDLYNHVIMEVPQPLTSPVLSSKRTTPERCPRPLLPQDSKQEDPNVPQDHQAEDLTLIKTTEIYVRGDEWCKEEIPTYGYPDPYNISVKIFYIRVFLIDPSRMIKDKDKMAERILDLNLEILFRLTGEDYTVVKKTSSECCQDPVSEGWGRPLSPITGPPPHPLIYEDINDQKILELTYKMIELLTGEVPIRCQDVTVYFSMEEWEYLEGHKDLYKDVMMDVPQPLTSPVLSSKRTTPERCPRPLLPQDCKQEDPDVPQDHQGENLTHINTTGTYVRGDERCKEEIPTYGYSDDGDRRSQGHLISSIFKSNDLHITQDTIEVYSIIPDTPSSLQSKDLSCDPVQQLQSSNSSQTSKKTKHHKRSVQNQNDLAENKSPSCSDYGKNFSSKYEKIDTKEKKFSCSKCGKKFKQKSRLVQHEIMHTGEKPYSCPECGKRFKRRSACLTHKKIHTGEKPYSCSECGKCYRMKAHLDRHERSHTGEKPYSCSECGKCFAIRESLVNHHRTHTGEMPYLCSECGKCFKQKSSLFIHKITHTGEKPHACTECGKCFTNKSGLVRHKIIHTREMPHACLECEKCFANKLDLVRHKIIHTGKELHACSECGKCFTKKSNLVAHKIIHTGEKPHACSECDKCFTNKSDLVKHKITHTGVKPHACSECEKCFTKKSDLVRHQITHTREEPHACSECGKCFTNKSDLVRHQITHTGGKSYSCLECGKCFTDISDLVTHNRTHKGNKPLSYLEDQKCCT